MLDSSAATEGGNPFKLEVRDGNGGPLELGILIGSQCVTLLAVPQVTPCRPHPPTPDLAYFAESVREFLARGRERGVNHLRAEDFAQRPRGRQVSCGPVDQLQKFIELYELALDIGTDGKRERERENSMACAHAGDCHGTAHPKCHSIKRTLLDPEPMGVSRVHGVNQLRPAPAGHAREF